MKQLTGIDATFLYMEGEAQFGHVSSLSIYERPSADYDPLMQWRSQIERRLHLLEPLTRRLRNVPFNLDHPFWIQDPDFDLDFHVRHTAVPAPGSREQIQNLVARIIGRPLDRARPLWESYVIEGLEGNRFAILTKIHHATVDGAAGAELMAMMLDTTPEGDPVPAPTGNEPEPEAVPSDNEMIAAAMASLARKPARFAVLGARTIQALGNSTNNPILVRAGRQLRENLRGPLGDLLNRGRSDRADERDELPAPLPQGAPSTLFNARITPHRSFAYRSVSMDSIRAIKSEIGCTVNDVVMSVCAGGLRTYLAAKGELPDSPLVASVPVSIRTGDEEERWTNRVSGIIAELPTDKADPIERIKAVNQSMKMAKGLHDALPASQLTEFADFPPPAVFARVSRQMARQQGRNANPGINLTISNVPGPRVPLYVAGARVEHYIPVSTIAHGQGLNITVQSYCDTLDFGLVACAELVPDLDELMDAIMADLEALASFAGIDVPVSIEAFRAAGESGKAAAAPAADPASTKKRVARTKAKTAPAKKRAPKKTGAKKTGAKKTGAKKTGAKKTGAKKSVAKNAPAKKAAEKSD